MSREAQTFSLTVRAVLLLALLAGTPFPVMGRGPSSDVQPLEVQQIAPGHYVHRGLVAVAQAANDGDIANIGFVVGRRCVAVIDTGNTESIGQRLLARIRLTTSLPVCHVINTHAHPDHLIGNAAFVSKPPAPPVTFIAHRQMPAALAARRAAFLDGLRREWGDAVGNVPLIEPTMLVDGERTIDLGERTLQLRAWPTAHTNNDLTVFDAGVGVLWMGDLGFAQHLPVVDGSVRGWSHVLNELGALPARIVVPGHGAVQAPGSVAAITAPMLSYLDRLGRAVRRGVADGIPLSRAMASLDAVAQAGATDADRDGWQLVEQFHRRNVSAAYAELEWE